MNRREQKTAYAREMQRILAPPKSFSEDEVTWLLHMAQNAMTGRNPEGKALIERMNKMLNRTEPVTYSTYRKVVKRLRKKVH